MHPVIDKHERLILASQTAPHTESGPRLGCRSKVYTLPKGTTHKGLLSILPLSATASCERTATVRRVPTCAPLYPLVVFASAWIKSKFSEADAHKHVP